MDPHSLGLGFGAAGVALSARSSRVPKQSAAPRRQNFHTREISPGALGGDTYTSPEAWCGASARASRAGIWGDPNGRPRSVRLSISCRLAHLLRHPHTNACQVFLTSRLPNCVFQGFLERTRHQLPCVVASGAPEAISRPNHHQISVYPWINPCIVLCLWCGCIVSGASGSSLPGTCAYELFGQSLALPAPRRSLSLH